MIHRLSPLSREMMVDHMLSNLDWTAEQFEQWATATFGVPIDVNEALELCRTAMDNLEVYL